MSLQDFVFTLIDKLLEDKDLGLTEEDIRFYGEGTTAEADEDLDSHIRWKNARDYNEDSNVIRGSLLIIRQSFDGGTEFANFHVNELTRIFKEEGLEGVYSIVKQDIQQVRSSMQRNAVLFNKPEDYEAVKESLIIRPLNYDNNTKVLADAVYRRTGDIALVLYLDFGKMLGENGNNILTAMVRQDMFQKWNMDEQAVFDWAMCNTMRLQPPVLYRVDLDYVQPKQPKENHYIFFMDKDGLTIDFNHPLAPLLTTEQEVNGAVALFYPGVLERLREIAGTDFYVVFAGISDVHIHPLYGKVSVGGMRRLLADVNKDLNKQNELLSRQIYRYNGEKKILTVV